MEKFKELGVDSIIEVGAGNVLTNLAKKEAAQTCKDLL